MRTPAIILLSGGQDSTTVFYAAKHVYDVKAALTFDYGQRHNIELLLARKTARLGEVPFEVLDVRVLAQLSRSTLTDESLSNVEPASEENNPFAAERGLPPSFTPGRNLVFFSLAAAYATKVGASAVVTGVCQQDRAGYPDCRREFITSMQESIRLGFDWPQFQIDAPLLDKSKSETWALAAKIGVLDKIVQDTNSCYEGDRSVLHEWGYGCNECGACIERRRGYEVWRLSEEMLR
jgi:7-cyano-7-deazaguanine synthase